MKQTAMQEHIEWLKATIEIAEEQCPILVNTLKLCLNDATQRLEMEKEQIIDFAYVIADDLACGVFRNKEDMEKRYEELLTFKSE